MGLRPHRCGLTRAPTDERTLYNSALHKTISKMAGTGARIRALAAVRVELRGRTGGTSGRTFGRGAAESGAASALAGARLGLRIDVGPHASRGVPEKDFGRRWRGLEAQTGHSGLRKCCLNMWVCVSAAETCYDQRQDVICRSAPAPSPTTKR